jgi:hypothetical protein
MAGSKKRKTRSALRLEGIGALTERVRVRCTGRCDRNANAGANLDPVFTELKWSAQYFVYPLSKTSPAR